LIRSFRIYVLEVRAGAVLADVGLQVSLGVPAVLPLLVEDDQ
jgi:hypothetical protein